MSLIVSEIKENPQKKSLSTLKGLTDKFLAEEILPYLNGEMAWTDYQTYLKNQIKAMQEKYGY